MYFLHKHGVKKGQTIGSKILLCLSVFGLGGGLYLLLLVLTPNIPMLYPVHEIDARSLPKPAEDKVYIPKIGVSVHFKTGGPEVLNDGVWQRFPERGDPTKGGNFILSAHRFEVGFTPAETRRKSPFYHVGKLEVGDHILVDFQGKRYGYEIYEMKKVKPNQVEIEEATEEPRLTLYTCTLQGQADGRDVVFARPLGEVKDGMVDMTQEIQ